MNSDFVDGCAGAGTGMAKNVEQTARRVMFLYMGAPALLSRRTIEEAREIPRFDGEIWAIESRKKKKEQGGGLFASAHFFPKYFTPGIFSKSESWHLSVAP